MVSYKQNLHAWSIPFQTHVRGSQLPAFGWARDSDEETDEEIGEEKEEEAEDPGEEEYEKNGEEEGEDQGE